MMHEPPAEALPRGVRRAQLAFGYELFCPRERPIGPG